MIEVENLTKRYGPTLAVSDVSFQVQKGEILGFLGPNGAGKTTTMRIITGFLSPTAGRVRVAGIDVAQSPIEAKKRLGYLPENPPVYPDMTVNEYLAFVGRIKGVPRGELTQRIGEVCEKCAVTDVQHRQIGRLSKGYRQRVGLAQAQSQYDVAQKHLQALKQTRKDLFQSAEGQLTQAKGRFLAAQAQLNYSEIRSPIDGVVTDRPLYPGDMATAGSPLMTIMDLSRVVARTYIPAAQSAFVKVGDAASVRVPGEPGSEAKGKVTVVSPALDPNSTTAQVWVEAPNPHAKLTVGSTVQVTMVVETIEKALVVPASALITGEDGSTSVMAIGADNHAHQTDVETGIRQGNDVQIIRGLKAGDKVVSEGAYGLPEGTKVKY